MKGLSSLERIILDCIGTSAKSHGQILDESGLMPNVCYNVLQAMIIRGILKTDGNYYQLTEALPPQILNEMNDTEARQAEALELIEGVLEQKKNRYFRFNKVALSERDEKIFYAMLSNLESFLINCHKISEKSIPVKDRKVIFWGVGKVDVIMNQIVTGRDL